jgi:transposase-like protein
MGKNKYLKNAKISEAKTREIIRGFALDFTATQTAELTGITRKSVNGIYNRIREQILESLAQEVLFDGEIEMDESYFGPTRVRGKRGRGAGRKMIVFGLLKRQDKVYTTIVPNCSREELLPIIKGHILEHSTVYTDGWRAYDGLIINGYDHHRIYHSENEFARGKNHVNGIESFWSFTKRRLAKFNGIQGKMFYLHLKESEFRFNNRNLTPNQLYKLLLKIMRKGSVE